jgi:alpha-N-arabinofuranosidase
MRSVQRRRLIAGITGLTAVVALTTLGPMSADAAATTITVTPAQTSSTISPLLLGGNGRWAYDNFGAWDPTTQAAYPAFVQAMKDSAITSMRYPGGTIANLYHFKRAIGPVAQRVDQVHASTGEPLDNHYGPDEWGKLSESLGNRGSIMVNFATGTPQEAADFVEYMTGVVGQNLNGGTDWAAVRSANGHAAPYDVPYWEVGNEANLSNQWYWRAGESATDKTTLYTFGGSTTFTKQRVGQPSDYRDSASVSTGAGGQSFVVKYAPVTADTAHVFVAGTEWTRTTNLSGAAATAKVYTLDESTGKIVFGDGTHGAVPASGAAVTVSYTSGPHPGFTDFYTAMKAANPAVQVCAGLDGAAPTTKFAQLMGTAHPYDCVEDHAYITGPSDTAIDADEYHGRLMLQTGIQTGNIDRMRQAIQDNAGARADQIKVVVTEYGQLGNGHPDANPNYHASLSEALLMANNLREFAERGIPLADKSNLTDFVREPAPGGSTAVGAPLNAMIAGPGPTFIVQPTGLLPNMFKPMTGSTVVASAVQDNPVRTLANGGQLPALTTLAGKAANGDLDLLVINEDPLSDATATVQPGLSHTTAAQVSTMNGPTILSRNLPGDIRVRITTKTVTVDPSFTYTFPAHSVTRIHLTAS